MDDVEIDPAVTQPLMDACFTAETTEEMQFCRTLVNCIADRSPYARKLLETREAQEILSERSPKALEETLKNTDEWEREVTARRRLEMRVEEERKRKGKEKMVMGPPPRSYFFRPCLTGVRIVERDGVEAKRGVAGGGRLGTRGKVVEGLSKVIVCALPAVSSLDKRPEETDKLCRSQERVARVMERLGREQRRAAREGGVVQEEMVYDGGDLEIYVEGDDGELRKFRVDEDFDAFILKDGHEIPMSPCTDSEWDSEIHTFLVVREGTPPSS